jgi:hypothetical protein
MAERKEERGDFRVRVKMMMCYMYSEHMERRRRRRRRRRRKERKKKKKRRRDYLVVFWNLAEWFLI